MIFMEMSEICKAYGLKQNNFYKWLRDSNMIVKEGKHYILGPQPFKGMKTLEKILKTTNEPYTVVSIEDENVYELVDAYKQSDESKLFKKPPKQSFNDGWVSATVQIVYLLLEDGSETQALKVLEHSGVRKTEAATVGGFRYVAICNYLAEAEMEADSQVNKTLSYWFK